jgi:NADH:ubiquinone oxidoreductase subunit 2 (subunit N)
MSVVSAGYYFKVVRAMFSLSEGEERAVDVSGPAAVAVLACAAATVGIGLFGSALLPALLPR